MRKLTHLLLCGCAISLISCGGGNSSGSTNNDSGEQNYQVFAESINQQIQQIQVANPDISSTSVLLSSDYTLQKSLSSNIGYDYFIIAESNNNYIVYWQNKTTQQLESINLTQTFNAQYPELKVLNSTGKSNIIATKAGLLFVAAPIKYDSNNVISKIFLFNPNSPHYIDTKISKDSYIYHLIINNNQLVAMDGGFYEHINYCPSCSYISSYHNGIWTDLVNQGEFNQYDFYTLSSIDNNITIAGIEEPSSEAVLAYVNGTWKNQSYLIPNDHGVITSIEQATNKTIYVADLDNSNKKPCQNSYYGTGSISMYQNGKLSTLNIPLLESVGVNFITITTKSSGGAFANINYSATCGSEAESNAFIALN